MAHDFKVGDKFGRKSDPKKCIGVVATVNDCMVTTADFYSYGIKAIVKLTSAAKVQSRARYTNKQLCQAFNNVKNPKGWKYAIRKVIENPGKKNLDCLAEAIVYFTGSIPFIVEHPNGKVHVVAAGYYSAIGA